MQATKWYFSDYRVAEAERAEAEAWIRRQARWERRLAQLRCPRPAPVVGGSAVRRSAA